MNSVAKSVRSLQKLDETTDRLDRLFQIERAKLSQEVLSTDARLADPRCLNRFEYQVFSQCGQDGIIAEIFRRLAVERGFFVEFGVGAGDGFETNTVNLLLQGWRGVWMEASAEACGTIRRNFEDVLREGRLRLEQTFVTVDNIADSFARAGIPTEFDLLSIDIDGNDPWIWQALRSYKPKCVSIEYNAYFPAQQEWIMPYRAEHAWEATIEYGASARSLERIGTELGYRLVACDIAGCDCFFVRSDLCGEHFAPPFTAPQWHHPARHFLVSRPGHARRLHEPFSSRRISH
jgi:hypothetical protein